MHLLAPLDLLHPEMKDFPTLSYAHIPTLLYTWSLKKVSLSDGAFPKKAIIGSSPPPPSPLGYLLT